MPKILDSGRYHIDVFIFKSVHWAACCFIQSCIVIFVYCDAVIFSGMLSCTGECLSETFVPAASGFPMLCVRQSSRRQQHSAEMSLCKASGNN